MKNKIIFMAFILIFIMTNSILVFGNTNKALAEETRTLFKNGEVITIEEGNFPLISRDLKEDLIASPDEKWAIFNLIITLTNFILGVAFLFVRQIKKTDDNHKSFHADRKDLIKFKILNLLIGIISVVFFYLTEDLSLEIQIIDKWTIVLLILLIDQLFAIYIIHNVAKGGFKKVEQWRKNI